MNNQKINHSNLFVLQGFGNVKKIFGIWNSWQSQEGFTLVELLVVIVIFSVVGAITGSILVSSLRTSNKANSLNVVKQNGDFVTTQAVKLLHSARVLKSPFPCGLSSNPTVQSSISVLDNYGTQINLSCLGNTIVSSGMSLLDTNAVVLVPGSCSFSCSQQTSSDYPLVSFQFSLISKTSSSFSEQTASAGAVPFFTSVSMRNMNR